MVKVKVLALNGCSHCNKLLDELDSRDISFKVIDANKNEALADEVEDFLGIDEYPIVIVDTYKNSHYVYRGDTYESLKEVAGGRVIKKGCLTVEDMAKYVTNLLFI